MERCAGADRRSGLVPPVPARSRAHTPARASHVAVAPGLPSVANPQRPSDGTGGQDIRPLARVHDGLPGIHVGDARLAVFHPEHHLSIRSIIALRHSSVQRVRGKWMRMRSSEEADAVTQSAYDVRRETRVSVLAPCSASRHPGVLKSRFS